jgi:RNA polymerase sigma factor (sigma-70 family)
MATSRIRTILPHLRKLVSRFDEQTSDRELLRRFGRERDEAAFAEIVRRHGPMVLRVCQRIVHSGHDAEDLCQAAFLLLAQKATSVRWRDSVAGWLFQTAYRLSLKAQTAASRRRQHETQAKPPPPADPVADLSVRELQTILDEELSRLPEKYRAPILLCCLEGKSRDETARYLGWTLTIVKERLEQGRERLRARLGRRGVLLGTALASGWLLEAGQAACANVLPRATAKAALSLVRGQATLADLLPCAVVALAKGVTTAMVLNRTAILMFVGMTLTAATAGGLAWLANGSPPREASALTAPPAQRDRAEGPAAASPDRVGKPPTDSWGDPLPPGAMARLGTLRFNSPDHVVFLAFSPDARALISQAPDGVRVWETATGKELKHLPALAGYSHGGDKLSPDGKTLATADPSGVLGLWDIANGARVRTLGSARLFRFAPDGKSIVTIDNDFTLKLWGLATGKTLRSWQLPEGGVSSVEFSRDGKTLITAGSGKVPAPADGSIRFWDVATGKETRKISTGSKSVNRIALSADGMLLASLGETIKSDGGNGFFSTRENFIRIWDVAAGKEVRQLAGPKGKKANWPQGFADFLFAPDGKTLVTSGHADLRVWDPATGKELRQIPLDYSSWGLAFSRDGKMLATVVGGLAIRLFDPASGKDLAPPRGNRVGFGHFSLSANGRNLATISDREVQVWDPVTGRLRRMLKGHKEPVTNIGLTADGRALFSASQDRSVIVSDLETGKELRRFQVDVPANGERLTVAPDGRTVAWIKGKSVLILDGQTGKEIKQLSRHEPWGVMRVVFIEGGKKLAVSSGDHKLHLWDLATERKILQFSFPMDRGREPSRRPTFPAGPQSYTVAISPDDRLIAYGSQGKYLALMELATGREIACFTDLSDGPCPMVFSPDGRMLAWGGWKDSPVRLMETATGKERRRLLGHKGRVVSLAYSADGKILVSGSNDATALVWDLAGRQQAGASTPLSAQQLSACWTDLAGEDAARAYQAIRKLARDPKRAVPFLDKRLQPVPLVEKKHLARLIADLDSPVFAVREKATRALEDLGEVATSVCRQALSADAPIEVRRRLQRLLDKHEQQRRNPSPEILQSLRALEILEITGTAEARRILARMSAGAAAARLTLDARASLVRLDFAIRRN